MNLRNQFLEIPPQNVLVVDDEPQVCELLAEMLSHMGHTVEVAHQGNEALAKLAKVDIGILITDMDMPGMDGMQLIQHLVEERQDIDIIAITGHTMRYQYTDVIAAGAADFVSKPFTMNEFQAKLNRLIRERLLRHELEHLAVRDPLTGLYNRRFFEKVVRQEVVRATRYQHALFLLFLDIDHFKDYNDLRGHQAGDELLMRLADVLQASIREQVDTAFRFGGDEFTVLLPCLNLDRTLRTEAAVEIAERIRENYNALGLPPTTLSIGVAEFLLKTGDVDQDIEDMIQRADNALYFAKHHLKGDKVRFDSPAAA